MSGESMRSVLEEHLDREGLSPGAARLATWLLAEVTEDGAGRALRDLVEELDPDDAWSGVDAVHRALDRALGSGDAPASEVEQVRRRAVDATREIHRAVLDAELSVHRSLLRDITHDIRSPLNSIMFLTDALFGEQSGPLNSVQKRQLGIVYSAAASLLNFVNDLLDFSRGGSSPAVEVAEVPFSIEGALSDARRLVAPILQHKGTELETEVGTSGTHRGDPQILTRVCINLLANAVEAADEGGEVSLRVRDTDGDRLVVEVCDDGRGADPQHLRELIGPPETQGDAARMIRGRTHGLGLLICGRLVRAAGGRIEVDRDERRRTRFTVTLPFPEA